MKPRILIPQPTSSNLDYNRANTPAYASAVRDAGGEPVEIPLTLLPLELESILASADGILLPGSPADVDPQGYGHELLPGTAPADPARETVDRRLLEETERTGIPLLGICFGMQMLNVWRGGTLVQDLTCIPVNHSAGPSVSVAHGTEIVAGSALGKLVAQAESMERNGPLHVQVNSSHHQAVGLVGQGLRVAARCSEDQVVEAIEKASSGGSLDSFLMGVQWHPERSLAQSVLSRALFSSLILAATVWNGRAAQQTGKTSS